MTYYLPLYWQAANYLTATQAALRLLPGIVAEVLGSLISGWVSWYHFAFRLGSFDEPNR